MRLTDGANVIFQGGSSQVSMSAPTLTPLLSQAVQDRTSGATGVARQVLAGLLELTSDRDLLHSIAEVLPGKFPGYASMWHISRAARSADPEAALQAIRRQLDVDVDRSVATAARLVRERGGSVRTAPSSALVKAVVAALPKATDGTQVTGLAGADAISPTTVLNIRGTLQLAQTYPTIVVTTSLKLVPESVFAKLGSPLFECIPLHLFHAVVLDGEVLSPAEAGARAVHIGPAGM
jgi:hypothetical protein